jgi:hypothetical protein
LSVLRLSDIEGYLFSCIMRYAYQKGILDRQSYIAQYVGLALFTAGATNSLGNDDLLAAFAAGTSPPPSQCCLSPIHLCAKVVRSRGMVISTNRQQATRSPLSLTPSSTAHASSISEHGSPSTDIIYLSSISPLGGLCYSCWLYWLYAEYPRFSFYTS